MDLAGKQFWDKMCQIHMCFCLFVLLLVCNVRECKGLKCWSCERSPSENMCIRTGRQVYCVPSQRSCFTTVRRYGDETFMWKGCKQNNACGNNKNQNKEGFNAIQNQCNNHLVSSMCTCCCKSYNCNRYERCRPSVRGSGSDATIKRPRVRPTVLTTIADPTRFPTLRRQSPTGTCPQISSRFQNGEVACSDSNKIGSVCEFTCTSEGFYIYPMAKAATSRCLSNGTWSQPKQCCARPCPPYLPMDLVVLVHAKDARNWIQIIKVFTRSMLRTYSLGIDALRVARIPFSASPHLEHAVTLNETNNMDPSTFFERAQMQTYNQLADGRANIGAALNYSLMTYLSETRHPDRHAYAVMVVTDTPSDDDVLEPAEALRKEGVLTFVQFFRPTGTESYDLDELLNIAGSEERVWIVDRNGSPLEKEQQSPLDYVCKDVCRFAYKN